MKSIWSTAFFFCVLGFVGWAASANSPGETALRVCSPVGWLGGLTANIVDLWSARYAGELRGWVYRTNVGCQRVVWKQFFADDYARALREYRERQARAAQGNTTRGPAQ